jgi:hypothetical protein
LNRNAATWSLATKLASEFDRTIADHCSEGGAERSPRSG